MNKSIVILMVLLAGSLNMMVSAQENNYTGGDTLVVVWTSGDFEVAEKMVYMYVFNAKRAGWFDEVIFIIWGPSAKLLSENEKLREYLYKMKDEGIILEACIACANMYGVADDLRNMGIDVKGMGSVLSDYLKKGHRVMTY
jgi:hypothetical protein